MNQLTSTLWFTLIFVSDLVVKRPGMEWILMGDAPLVWFGLVGRPAVANCCLAAAFCLVAVGGRRS